MIFEFEPNEYFTNTIIEKTYNVTKELIIDNIQSTKIQWNEGKDITKKPVEKKIKNKSKGYIRFKYLMILSILAVLVLV